MQQPTPDLERGRTSRRLAARSAAAPWRPPPGATADLKAVIEALSEAVFVVDREGRVRLANPAAARLFAGRPVRSRQELLARFEPLPSRAPPGEPMTLRSRDRPNSWFELRSFPIGRPSPATPSVDDSAGWILVLRDVTDVRREQVERKAVLSILSHELRTPITTIYAGSRVLARRGTVAQRASTEIAADISAEAARLYDVVEDLLVLTRVEQQMLELSSEPVLLQRLIEAAVRVAAARNPDVPIVKAGATEPPAVRGDSAYLEQVVRDLVTTASRFAGPGSPVIVRLEEDDDEVLLRVLDRGPDPTDAELAEAFELIDRAPRGRRSGAGIGPFVCRRLVEAMGGRVWAGRRDEGGAELGFALPRYVDADDRGAEIGSGTAAVEDGQGDVGGDEDQAGGGDRRR